MIHFGKGGENQIHNILDFCRHKSPYREANKINKSSPFTIYYFTITMP